MDPGSSKQRRRPRPKVKPPVRIAPAGSGTPIRQTSIRWDRLSVMALGFLVLLIMALYASPARSYLHQRSAASAQQTELQLLGREHRELKRQVQALKQPATIELEARKLGMVKDGERPYVISSGSDQAND